MTGTDPGEDTLARQVDGLLPLVRGTLQGHRAHDLDRALAAEDARITSQTTATVVVVGEAKRGKSSLVNALIGRPGLCPVDEDLATNTWLVLRPGPDGARVHLAGHPDPESIAIADLARYATVDGNPGNELGVQSIEVTVPSPLLDRLCLVDTPGVGGLDAGHGRLALDAIRSATTLLFVVDCNAPVSQPELDFLAEAAARCHSVVFAITKVDRYPGWRRVAGDTQALLARDNPRYASAPFIGVSSTLAETAAAIAGSNPDKAAEFADLAGINRLTDVLAGLAGQAPAATAANRLRAVQATLEAANRRLGEQLLAAQGDRSVEQALEAEERRLQDLMKETTDWGSRLSQDLSLLHVSVLGSLGDQQAAAARRVDERLTSCGPSELGSASELVQAEAEAMHRDVVTRLADGFLSCAVDRLGQVSAESALRGLVDRTTGTPYTFAVPEGAKTSPTTPFETMTSVSTGWSATMMLQRLPTLLGPLLPGAVAFPAAAPLVFGVVWATVMARGRKRAGERMEVRRWAAGAIGEASRAISRDVEQAFIKGQHFVAAVVRQEIERRIAEVRADREACAEALRQNEAARRSAGEEIRSRQHQLGNLARQSHALLQMAVERLETPAPSL